MGSKRRNDSAIEQFVFFCVNVSVAAVNIESSICGVASLRSFPIASAPEGADGIAFGSCDEVFKAGPLSLPGDGGGVGYALWPEDLDCHTERKLSKPLAFGRRNWYVIG